MIGAALVFSNPAAFGLPQVRGIFLRMLKCIDASLHLMRVAHEALVLSGCLRHTLDFSQRFLIFRCTSRGTKYHGYLEVIDNGAVAYDQSSVPSGFSGLLFSGRRP
jgi:hypothetical protein